MRVLAVEVSCRLGGLHPAPLLLLEMIASLCARQGLNTSLGLEASMVGVLRWASHATSPRAPGLTRATIAAADRPSPRRCHPQMEALDIGVIECLRSLAPCAPQSASQRKPASSRCPRTPAWCSCRHALLGRVEAAGVAEFGQQHDGGEFVDAAQRLERGGHRRQRRLGQGAHELISKLADTLAGGTLGTDVRAPRGYRVSAWPTSCQALASSGCCP